MSVLESEKIGGSTLLEQGSRHPIQILNTNLSRSRAVSINAIHTRPHQFLQHNQIFYLAASVGQQASKPLTTI